MQLVTILAKGYDGVIESLLQMYINLFLIFINIY